MKLESKAYHSGESEADNSMTPKWLVSQLEGLANVIITHDVCATELTAQAMNHWCKEDDALSKDWFKQFSFGLMPREAFWMNPPFSKSKAFTAKASDAAKQGVVTLGCVKHAPDAAWFQELERNATAIFVPNSRVQFLKSDGTPFMREDKKSGKMVRSGANFPVCFPLWTPFPNGGQAKFIRFNLDKK